MVSWYKKLAASTMIGLVLFLGLAGSFMAPSAAQAQIPVSVVASVPDTTKAIYDQIWEGLKSGLLSAASRIIAYGVRRIAYDSAVWLASGGKGQTPFAHTKNFGDYLRNVGDDALGQGIEALGRPFGLNLCKIPDIKVDLALKIGIRSGYRGVSGDLNKPACSMSQFLNTWSDGSAIASKFTAAGNSITSQLNNALDFSAGNDGGLLTVLDTQDIISNGISSAIEAAKLQRQEGQGYKAKETEISKQTVTPPGIIKKEFENNTPGDTLNQDEAQIRALLTTGDIKVIPNVLSLFLNTLVSSMVRNYQEKGILPFGICVGTNGGSDCGPLRSPAGSYESLGVVSSRQVAQDAFSDFLTVQISDGDNYDVLSQLGNCSSHGMYNCRANQGLIQAARETENKQPVTIQQAIDRGLLRADYKLIPPSRLGDNADPDFCSKAYCFYNVKVLRQVRLLPLGFEIAAKNSDPDRPWTLGQVVKGFNDCQYFTNAKGEKTVVYNPGKYPFCHLIDPSWVLKVPETRCKANVNSAIQLTPDAPTRLQDCTDLTSCVAYNSDGTCANYGYCSREQNTWNFSDANKCDQQWRTCQSFQNNQTGETANYLQRTLDTGSCSQTDAGCQGYSVYKDGAGPWQQLSAITNQKNFAQQALYFNAQLPQSCSADSDGCNAFQVASSTGDDLRYLRKAPDYLGCYDTDPVRAGIQWPQLQADLGKLPTTNTCAPYAAACVPDEVGCAFYTNKQSNEQIPGKITQQNVCAAQCVGYNAYQELPSNYSNGQSLAYVIPNSAPQCKNTEVGCSSFTNLSTDVNGQEKVEYYSFLRPCEQPNKKTTRTYTTFEGSTQGGFQLKSYSLVADVDGTPAQWYKTPADLADYTNPVNGCTEALYKAGKANPDCRQFNDDAGKVSYKLLAKTIPVTDQCTPYRLNSNELDPAPNLNAQQCLAKNGFWDGATCNLCFQNGEYDKGFCTYFGLPGTAANSAGNSSVCSEQVDSCRAFRGNNGFNVQNLYTDNFEVANIQAVPEWKGNNVRLTKESTHPGEQSLGATMNGVNGTPLTRDFKPLIGQSYSISFWAKGTTGLLSVLFNAKDNSWNGIFGNESVGETWRYYTFGPIQYDGKTQPAVVSFVFSGAGALFVDNFSIKQLNGVEYRVKNKLTVPNSCDPIQNDNLPGPALGCTVYSQGGQDVPLTGFDYLCRENAIGCTAFVDTHNTLTSGTVTPSDQGPRLYRVWLPGDGTAKEWKLFYNNNSVGSCRTSLGDDGCYIQQSINDILPADLLANASVDNDGITRPVFNKSTVYIEGDSQTPIYLVNNPAQPGQCSASNIGCVSAGLEKQNASGVSTFTDVVIKNDPALYDTTLCKHEAVGCFAYTNSVGGTVYFKDPKVMGQKICSFVTDNILPTGQKTSGWYWKGMGTCAENAATTCSASTDCANPKVCSNNANQSCTADADCGNNNKCVESCKNIGTIACYPSYIDENNQYGLWSYGDKGRYENFVGECPATQNGCTEFADHNDLNSSNQPHTYYYIKNDKITTDSCNGQASLKNGCVLLDETSNPAKYWATTGTYALSDASDGIPVKPVVADVNDANIILKVKPDRTCAEWIQCRQSYTAWDVATAKPKTVCQAIGRCAAYNPANPTECTKWIDGSSDISNTALSEATYVQRRTIWGTHEFSGLSILDQFPVEELSQVNISVDKNLPDWRLAKAVPCGGGLVCSVKNPNSQSSSCDTGKPQDGSLSCGRNSEGVCFNGVCVRNIEGGRDTANLDSKLHQQICRAYPEADAPFPNTFNVAQLNGKGSQTVALVNICNENSKPQTNNLLANACDCDYTKARYGDSVVKYWNYQRPATFEQYKMANGGGLVSLSAPPSGLCFGSDKVGQVCSVDSDCYTNANVPVGTCQHIKSDTKFLGWRGYCLEYDMSRNINANQNEHPCLTWYPLDALTGALDINSQHTEAGYVSGNLPYFCAAANGAAGLDPFSGTDASTWLKLKFNDAPDMKANQTIDDIGLYAYSGQWDGFGNTGDDSPIFGKASNPGSGIGQGMGYRERFYAYGDPNVAPENNVPRQNSSPSLSKPVFLQDIEKITITVSGKPLWKHQGNDGPDYSSENENPKPGTEFEIYPTDFTAKNGVAQNYYDFAINKGDDNYRGHAATGRYLNRPNDLVLFYGGGQSVAAGGNGNQGDDNEYQFIGLDKSKVRNVTHVCIAKDKKDCRQLDGNIFSSNNLNYGGEGIWDRQVTNEMLCPEGAAEDGNIFAVRLHFNDRPGPNLGILEWYDTFFCDGSGGSGGVRLFVKYQMKDWCPLIADASSPSSLADQQTAAWTDRVWKYRSQNYPRTFDVRITNNVDPLSSFIYSINTAAALYGNVGYTQEDGMPTKNQVILTPANVYPNPDTCITRLTDSCTHVIGSPKASYYGAPYSCTNGFCVRTEPPSQAVPSGAITVVPPNDISLGRSYLGELFAKVGGYWEFDALLDRNAVDFASGYKVSSGKEKELTQNDFGYTMVGDTQTQTVPVPPVVNPIVPGSCRSDGLCLEDQSNPRGGISINNLSSGEVNVLKSSEKVFVRFYMHADDNQMPIRGVSIDWTGDNNSVVPNEGYFFNLRGLIKPTCKLDINDPKNNESCVYTLGNPDNNQLINTGQTCQSAGQCVSLFEQCSDDAGLFGYIKSAHPLDNQKHITCQSRYYEAQNVYTCNKSLTSWKPQDQCGVNKDLYPDGCCIYTPRVQVKDNWGWCNGTCSQIVQGKRVNGCFGGDHGPGKDKNLGRCDDNNAWTNFGGKVIVASDK